MVLYDLFCIAAHNPTSPTNLRQLIEGVSRQIHDRGGVIRDLKNMGVGLYLPQRAKRHQQYHHRGDYFLMSFDTSPIMLATLREQLRRDPLVIQWTFIKKGDKLKDLFPPPPRTIDYTEPEISDSSRR